MGYITDKKFCKISEQMVGITLQDFLDIASRADPPLMDFTNKAILAWWRDQLAGMVGVKLLFETEEQDMAEVAEMLTQLCTENWEHPEIQSLFAIKYRVKEVVTELRDARGNLLMRL